MKTSLTRGLVALATTLIIGAGAIAVAGANAQPTNADAYIQISTVVQTIGLGQRDVADFSMVMGQIGNGYPMHIGNTDDWGKAYIKMPTTGKPFRMRIWVLTMGGLSKMPSITVRPGKYTKATISVTRNPGVQK